LKLERQYPAFVWKKTTARDTQSISFHRFSPPFINSAAAGWGLTYIRARVATTNGRIGRQRLDNTVFTRHSKRPFTCEMAEPLKSFLQHLRNWRADVGHLPAPR